MFMKNYNVKPFKSFLYHLFLKYNYLYRGISLSFDPEMKYINTFTRDKDIALDIGANIGIYTRYLAKNFNRVESFEPIQQAYKYIESLDLKNVKLHKVALSNKQGKNFINVPVKSGVSRLGNSSIENLTDKKYQDIQKSPIKTELLDYYNYQKIDFIKIDVEGHELKVLEGGKKTIKRLKPLLLIEIEQRHLPSHLSINDVFNYIKDMGYDGYFLYHNVITPINNFNLKRDQLQYLDSKRIKLTNRRKSELYINNFFFIEKQE